MRDHDGNSVRKSAKIRKKRIMTFINPLFVAVLFAIDPLSQGRYATVGAEDAARGTEAEKRRSL